MPELPEVETIRKDIGPHIIGRTISQSETFNHHKFTPARKAVGETITDLTRRGKYLIAETSGSYEVVIHLGMTGRLTLGDAPGESPHARWWWVFSAEPELALTFSDIRRFGRCFFVDAGDYEAIPTLSKIGPEPFDPSFTPKEFSQRINQGVRHIKTKLLSQQPVAGIGNIYADEALWSAKVDPRRRNLTLTEATSLLEAIRSTLGDALNNRGTTLSDYRDGQGRKGSNQLHLSAYGRYGQPCLRCDTQMQKLTVDGRATSWCPKCQR